MIQLSNRDAMTQPKANRLYPALLLTTLLVSACSDGGGGSQASDDPPTTDAQDDDRPGLVIEGLNGVDASMVTSPWLAVVNLFRVESATPGSGDAFVGLVQYNNDFPASQFIDFYTTELDTCEIRDNTEPDGGDGGDEGGTPPPRISGGETVVINTPSGPWFSIERTTDDDVSYSTNNGLPGALPSGATLSIPGDAFPTVAAYPLVEPEPPVRLTPELDEPVSVDSEYTWMPGNPAGFIQITLLEFASNGDFLGFPVNCDVVDDGSFTLPANVLSFITASPNELRMRYSRVINRLDIINGIVFSHNSEVAE